MLHHLWDYALNRPRAIETAGELVTWVAGVALLGGFIIKALVGVLTSLPGALGPMNAQQFMPGLPTWWVPESAVGVVAWALVLGLGLSALFGGKQLRRALEAYR